MPLDPDDPRPPYLQVAGALRAGILTKKFAAGEKLPSGQALAEHFGVARMTVQQGIRILRDEGLVVSRAGSGVYVRERTEKPVGLRPHIERAFESQHVTIDFFGFSGETLHGAMQEPLDKIRSGRLSPKTISLRVLVPDTSRPWGLPVDATTRGDDPAFRERADGIMRRHLEPLVHSLQELQELGLVETASPAVRVHQVPPLMKVYIINQTEAFFGYYPVVEHSVDINGDKHTVLDLMGKDATLFHHDAGDDPEGIPARYVRESLTWFDSIWSALGVDLLL